MYNMYAMQILKFQALSPYTILLLDDFFQKPGMHNMHGKQHANI